MFPEATIPSGGYRPGSPRERAVSTVLSIAVIVVAVLLALWQSGVVAPVRRDKPPVTFDIVDRGRDEAAGEKRDRPEKTEAADRSATVPVASPVPVPSASPTEDGGFAFLRLSRDDLATADIGAMKPRGGAAASDGGGGADRGKVQGPGEGPGGIVLHPADWYRRPTNAELSTYLPRSATSEGWGAIACQPADRWHVDNCYILSESPVGSGFGRAVLNASWQFLVRPPRVNGKAEQGVWISIRIDYTTAGASPRG